MTKKRIGIYGWGVVAPRSPNIGAFERNLEDPGDWLSPFRGFGPNNFLVGTPEFSFSDYKAWIDERFEPRKFSQLDAKMGDLVKYALGAFIQALGQNSGLESELARLGTQSHIYIGTGLGDFPVQHEISLRYHQAQGRWNRFWCREPHHPELAAYRRGTTAEQESLRMSLGAPPDPAGMDVDDDGFEEVRNAWFSFWVERSAGLITYLEELREIEGEDVPEDVEAGKGHVIRRKISGRQRLAKRYGCPTEPWNAVDPSLLWNIPNIPAAQISMLGHITGPALAPIAACSGFGTALKLAINAIRAGQATAAVIGSADPPPHPLSVGTFFGARVLSNDGRVSKPFTGFRGTHVAGGACVWIVGDADYFEAKGFKPLGLEILSVALTSDADHIITPSQQGPRLAVEEALADAGVRPQDVSTWDMHATATPGDWTELENMLGIFPGILSLTARKGTFGHGMSVCGGWELTAQHLGLAKGKIHPVDLDEGEVHAQIRPYVNRIVRRTPGTPSGDVAGKLNMGVGGINACVISRRWPEK